ncbi:MAG: YIP1 family protein [Chloroherpetonaceae bacterium]
MDFKKLVIRIKNLLLRPKSEWLVIEEEPVYESQEIIRDYALPLIFATVFWELVVVGIRLKMVYFAIVNFTLLMLALFLTISFVYDLSPRFHSYADRNAAAKLVAYCSTPLWLAQLVQADVEWLFFMKPIGFGLAAYLYHTGVPILMKPSESRRAAYTTTILLIVLTINTLVWLLLDGARRFFANL